MSGEPGTRVPYVWFEGESKRLSTLDLFDGRFVLLMGAENDAWFAKATQIATTRGIPLAAYRMGNNTDLSDPSNNWAQRMGLSTNGAILIRPDNFVAWRANNTATISSFEAVLDRILCRSIKAASNL